MSPQQRLRAVVGALQRNPRGLRLADIAREAGVHHRYVGALVRELLDDGWVAHAPSLDGRCAGVWRVTEHAPRSEEIPDEQGAPEDPRALLCAIVEHIRSDPDAGARIVAHAHRYDATKHVTTPEGAVRAVLGVDATTLRRWMHGGRRPPLCAPLLLQLALAYEGEGP